MAPQTPQAVIASRAGSYPVFQLKLDSQGITNGALPQWLALQAMAKRVLSLWELALQAMGAWTPQAVIASRAGSYPVFQLKLDSQGITNGALPQWLALQAVTKRALSLWELALQAMGAWTRMVRFPSRAGARQHKFAWLGLVFSLAAGAQTPGPVRSLPLSQVKSGLSFSGSDVQALQRDEFANPAQLWLSQGAALWGQAAANGKSCKSCHGDVASLKGVATRYPAIDRTSGRLFNLEDRINHCTVNHQQATVLAPESDALLGLTWYVTQASKGLPIRVDIGGAARPHWQAGADVFQRRQGQLNLSCAQCHDQHFGQRLYTDALSQGQPNGYPVYRLEWQKPGSLERRLRSCYAGIRAEIPPWGATEMRQLALYLMWRGEGLPIEVPAVRK